MVCCTIQSTVKLMTKTDWMKETWERQTRRNVSRPNIKLMLLLETRLSRSRKDSIRCRLQRFLMAEWLRKSTVDLMLSRMVDYVAVSLRFKQQTSCSNNQKLGIESAPETWNNLLSISRVVKLAISPSRPLTSIEDHEDLIQTWVVKYQLQVLKQSPLRWNMHLPDHMLPKSHHLRLPQVAGVRTCLHLCTVGTLLRSPLISILYHLQLVLSVLVDSRNWASRSCTEYF